MIIRMVECEQCNVAEEVETNEKLPADWIEIKHDGEREQFCSWDCVEELAKYRAEYAKLPDSEKFIRGLRRMGESMAKIGESYRKAKNL